MSEGKKTVIAPIKRGTGRQFLENPEDMEYRVEMKENGQTYSKSLGTYDQSVFPNSRHTFRPEYDLRKGTFVAIKEDGSMWATADFQKLLKDFPLTYPDSHPRRGQAIDRVDPLDPDDPYLSHPYWERTANSGSLTLNDAAVGPLTEFYRGEGFVGEGVGDGPVSGDKYFEIIDPTKQAKQDEAKMNKHMRAVELFTSMKDDSNTLRDVLVLLNEQVDHNTPISTMQTLVFDYVNSANYDEGGISKQDLFVQFAEMTPFQRMVHLLVKEGIDEQKILDKGGIYEFRGWPIGSNASEAVAYFADGKNNRQLLALKVALGKMSKAEADSQLSAMSEVEKPEEEEPGS